MSTELEIQQLVETATKSVHALRISRLCNSRTKETRPNLMRTPKKKQAKIEQDIGALIEY